MYDQSTQTWKNVYSVYLSSSDFVNVFGCLLTFWNGDMPGRLLVWTLVKFLDTFAPPSFR